MFTLEKVFSNKFFYCVMFIASVLSVVKVFMNFECTAAAFILGLGAVAVCLFFAVFGLMFLRDNYSLEFSNEAKGVMMTLLFGFVFYIPTIYFSIPDLKDVDYISDNYFNKIKKMEDLVGQPLAGTISSKKRNEALQSNSLFLEKIKYEELSSEDDFYSVHTDIVFLNKNMSLLADDFYQVRQGFKNAVLMMDNILINSVVSDKEISAEIIKKYNQNSVEFYRLLTHKGISPKTLVYIQVVNIFLLACTLYFFSYLAFYGLTSYGSRKVS